jgi:hypothetical protein
VKLSLFYVANSFVVPVGTLAVLLLLPWLRWHHL